MTTAPSLKPDHLPGWDKELQSKAKEHVSGNLGCLKKSMEVITKGSDDSGLELRLDSELESILLRTRQPNSYGPCSYFSYHAIY